MPRGNDGGKLGSLGFRADERNLARDAGGPLIKISFTILQLSAETLRIQMGLA